MEMKAKATDNVTSVKLNVIKLFTCTQVLVLEIRNNVIEIGIRVLKQIHLNMVLLYHRYTAGFDIRYDSSRQTNRKFIGRIVHQQLHIN